MTNEQVNQESTPADPQVPVVHPYDPRLTGRGCAHTIQERQLGRRPAVCSAPETAIAEPTAPSE